ncbi:penicillin-binding protein 2 [Anaerolentibacter hominis]|uniref:peptidoglycan D,D-transpeptidase FtsI family protein n=1 Tax=Anaerolentibacter hominis TaxID=3079009 RepID=UPI0031B7FE66
MKKTKPSKKNMNHDVRERANEPVIKKVAKPPKKKVQAKKVQPEKIQTAKVRTVKAVRTEEPEKETASGGTRRVRESRINREMLFITYVFVVLFVMVIGNMVYFVAARSGDVINSPYNYRQDILAERVVRGSILSSDGTVLAETVTNSKGKETRKYPYNNMFCHVVGRFNKSKTGIEASQDFTLLTSHDNAIKNAITELSGEKTIGDNVYTTLNFDLQKTAYEALGNRRGAVVALEPGTGKVLAMVSKPDYDPNRVDELWESLIDDEQKESALFNRATQGLYPPGSTFKILTALEYLRENSGYKNYSFRCEGKTIVSGVPVSCYNNKVHGQLDLIAAFAKSCNGAFASIGSELDMAKFRALCESFVFNQALPTALTTEKSQFVLNEKSDKGEIPLTAIGQGDTLLTPLHNAMIAATVANGGVMMKPYVIDRVESSTGSVVEKYSPEVYDTLMTAKEAKTLTKMMKKVVEEGTGRSLKNSSYSVAGKTGSAENDQGAAHAWFVGFAPADNPEIVVCVVVENVGAGSEYAVPIAKRVLNTYFSKTK